ncbi:MAG: DUF2851 family protein [Candidatus Methylacidiphilales bacterium]
MTIAGQPALVEEAASRPPTEREMQALWFERWFSGGDDCRVLCTEEGTRFEVIQQGIWNHGPGPDFAQVCIRWLDKPEGSVPAHLLLHKAATAAASDTNRNARPPGKAEAGSGVEGETSGTAASSAEATVTGFAELHLYPRDWEAHGHGADPAYEDVILHIVWEPGPKRFFPATAAFRRVPQVVLSTQLIAPWETLRPLLDVSGFGEKDATATNETAGKTDVKGGRSEPPLPSARPGRCSVRLSTSSIARIREVVRSAGQHRLEQKAARWQWRSRVSGADQALWEALAEGLGYSRNKLAFRLLAQRLPCADLRRLPAMEASALIFGVAGMLPSTRVDHLPQPAQDWLRPRWEAWWKRRPALAHAILPRGMISLSAVRPANRPERRLAALALLSRPAALSGIVHAVAERSAERFSERLAALTDPFWDAHATLTSELASGAAHALVGSDRIGEMLTNIYWPFVAMRGPQEARTAALALDLLPGAENKLTKLARQRILGGASLKELGSSALVQQGLLQIYQDYCTTDVSACALCPFPEILDNWKSADE